jgi:hypothetical protein
MLGGETPPIICQFTVFASASKPNICITKKRHLYLDKKEKPYYVEDKNKFDFKVFHSIVT